MLREFIEDIYEEIAIHQPSMSHKRFSKDYLGKHPTYLSYLRAHDAEPSIDALVKLWGRLTKDRQCYEHALSNSTSVIQNECASRQIERSANMEQRTFEAIKTLARYGAA